MKNKVIMLLIAVFSAACPSNSQPKEGSSSLVRWESFNAGLIKAKEQEKHIIIDFYADWCHWCKVMDKETFSSPDVAEILNRNFIPVRINTDKNEDITYKGVQTSSNRFASVIGVRGLPTYVFMDKDGNLIDMVPGYIKRDIFVGILNYVDEECYKKQVSFEDYMNKKADCN